MGKSETLEKKSALKEAMDRFGLPRLIISFRFTMSIFRLQP